MSFFSFPYQRGLHLDNVYLSRRRLAVSATRFHSASILPPFSRARFNPLMLQRDFLSWSRTTINFTHFFLLQIVSTNVALTNFQCALERLMENFLGNPNASNII
jgi:hypothetical protein